jgi:Fe-S-cluster containining protein
MIIQLSKNYASRYGTPAIDRVNTSIFELKYFAHCMSCNFCDDWCCWHGADVDVHNANRIMSRAAELEKYTGIPQQEWFDESEMCEDEEAPGQLWWRTSNSKGTCVFLNRKTRGCMLHSFALQENMDYHELKPMVCSIFPLTFEEGLLVHADEVEDRELVCAGNGPSLYSGVRSELLYYFGQDLIQELDSLNTSY